jgi:phospholipase C
VDLAGAYHDVPSRGDAAVDLPAFRGRPYGLGPRVPMYVVSPWSRGGWVNSQVFDHTSVIRFLEQRFGFHEPNISPWRRAVCGDLTSAFDFTAADRGALAQLPDPRPDAVQAAALPRQVRPDAPAQVETVWQEPGTRRSRPLPYRLVMTDAVDAAGVQLRFDAGGGAGAVFHVYDRLALDAPPRRYTVAGEHGLTGHWAYDAAGRYDLWVLGPNGFHRHVAGHRDEPRIALDWRLGSDALSVIVPADAAAAGLTIVRADRPGEPLPLRAGPWHGSLAATQGWYDVTVRSEGAPHFVRRLAGRLDAPGRPSISCPFTD